jgi:hypothetical protein
VADQPYEKLAGPANPRPAGRGAALRRDHDYDGRSRRRLLHKLPHQVRNRGEKSEHSGDELDPAGVSHRPRLGCRCHLLLVTLMTNFYRIRSHPLPLADPIAAVAPAPLARPFLLVRSPVPPPLEAWPRGCRGREAYRGGAEPPPPLQGDLEHHGGVRISG